VCGTGEAGISLPRHGGLERREAEAEEEVQMKWSLTLSSLILLSQPSSRMHSLHMVQFRWFLTYALPVGQHQKSQGQ